MSLPKFGMLTNPTIDVLKEIRTVAKFDFDFVEIEIEGPEGKPEILLKKRVEILKLLKKNKLFAIGHSPWWAELGTEYEPVRLAWLNECKKIINTARELGISLINFHSHSRGMYTGDKKNKKKILDNLVESLKELVEYGKKYNVEIMLENAVEKREITGLEDIKYIINRVPNLKVHLDVGHAFIFGGMNNIGNCIMDFRNKIEHVHMHDNHGMSDEHLPIGRGEINWIGVVKMLKEIDYNKTIALEVFSKNRKDVVKSREKIKTLWNRY